MADLKVARIPRIQLQLGDLRKIFGTEETKGINRDYLLKDHWNDLKNETIELQEDLGIVTLRGLKAPLNTVIDVAQEIPVNTVLNSLNYILKKCHYYINPRYPALVLARYDKYVNPPGLPKVVRTSMPISELIKMYDLDGLYPDMKYAKYFVNVFTENYDASIYTISGENNVIYNPSVSTITTSETQDYAIVDNVIPIVNGTTPIRIGQLNSNPKKYIINNMKSNSNFEQHPNIYIEVHKKSSPVAETGITGWQRYTEKNEHTSIPGPLNISSESFMITFCANLINKMHILLQVGENPMFIYEDDDYFSNSGLNVTRNKKETITSTSFEKFHISVRTYPAVGTIVIESSLFEKPWIIDNLNRSYNSLNKSDKKKPAYIPSGTLGITTMGMGQFTVAVSNILFFACDQQEGKTYDYSKSYSGYLRSPKIESDFKITEDFPSIIDNTLAHKDSSTWATTKCFKSYEEQPAPPDEDAEKSYYWILYLFSNHMLRTPFVSLVNIKKDADYTDPVQELNDIGVESITTKFSVEDNFKIKKTGSITFTHKKVYLAGYGYPPPLFQLDWENKSIQYAIKIKFGWDNMDGIPVDYNTLFTGFMRNPKIDHESYGESTCTYELVDRWQQLADGKIMNPKWYDGTSYMEAIRDLCAVSGLNPTTDVHFSDIVISDDYTLPMAPNGLGNPQFKFKVNTTSENGIKTLTELYNYATYFDDEGILQVIAYQDFLNSDTPVLFADSWLDYESNPVDLQYPWNSIQSPNFERDTSSVSNSVYLIGVNMDRSDLDSTVLLSQALDKSSIDDVNATNYIGYEKRKIVARKQFTTSELRNAWVNKELAILSQPAENYRFKTFGNLLQPFTAIHIAPEAHIQTGVVPLTNYWLVGNTFTFTAKDLSATSEMEVTYKRGLSNLYGE